MSESNFWKTVKRNLPSDCHATRIENRHGGCIPDAHIIWDSLAFWLELKITKSNKVLLSPHQISWNTAYSHKGGVNFILVKRVGERCLFLFDGGQSAQLSEVGLDLEPLVRASGFGELFRVIRDFGVRASGSNTITNTRPLPCVELED